MPALRVRVSLGGSGRGAGGLRGSVFTALCVGCPARLAGTSWGSGRDRV